MLSQILRQREGFSRDGIYWSSSRINTADREFFTPGPLYLCQKTLPVLYPPDFSCQTLKNPCR